MLLDTYQIQSSSSPTPDIMALRGRRLAFASETKDGVRLSANKIKLFTGGDQLTGRNPHDKYETTFNPTHTLILSSNYRPEVDAKDQALWDRIINVPFEVRFVSGREPKAENERKADPYLREKLRAEAPGILGWLVEGCLKWQIQGLDLPEKISNETQQYQQEEDVWQKFYDECVEPGDDLSVSAQELYDVFVLWWKKNVSKNAPKQQKFGRMIRPMFLDKKQSTGGVTWYYGGCLSEAGQEFLSG
jgi:putative DNA primase/helicase